MTGCTDNKYLFSDNCNVLANAIGELSVMEKISIARRRLEINKIPVMAPAKLCSIDEKGGFAETSKEMAFPLTGAQINRLNSLDLNGLGKLFWSQMFQEKEGVLILKLEQETIGNLLDCKEAAALLGVSRQSIYRLVKHQRIKALHIGRALRFTREELSRFVTLY